ncbi:MAG: NAD(P)/FAD-dependent oxidoreductase, partial [Deltaproteobacteria bacterium]|nr:NAD(P)/FAD-dependent oxidoreductase [Deltaproteobacteria bacterium]
MKHTKGMRAMVKQRQKKRKKGAVKIMTKDIEIVGSGPAGLVAAINLAKAGCKVTVYEEKSEVGHRFHGDFQGLENWSSEEDAAVLLERLGIKTNYTCQPYSELTVFDVNLDKRIIRSQRPLFYLVQRGHAPGCLDHGLMEQAKEADVEIVFNKRVDKLESGGIVGIGPRAADAIAKGIIFNTTMEDTAAAILDDRLAPKGYSYLLIHKNKATMATCMFKDFKREKECFERTVETFKKVFPELNMTDAKEFGGYGNFFFDKPAFEGGKYYVGEAAGLQDCLWGFGMKYAMTSGFLAARAIIENKDYEALVRDNLIPMQKASLVNRFIFEMLGNNGYRY